MYQLFLFTILALWSVHINANTDSWYNVDVIVFSQHTDYQLNSEIWPTEWELPKTDLAIDFSDNNKHAKFKRNAHISREMSGVLDALKRSNQYEVITSVSWQQPGLNAQHALGVRLTSPRTYPSREGQQLPELEGTLTIQLSRFLHVYTDLLYIAPIETETVDNGETEHPIQYHWQRIVSQQTEASTLQGFPLKTHRKVKSDTLTLIDHPIFAVMVYITPIKR